MSAYRQQLEREASGASTSDLHELIKWNVALAEHYDENMMHNEYNIAQMRLEVARAELTRRGE